MRTLFTLKFEEIFLIISNKKQGYKQENTQKTQEIRHFLIFLLFTLKKIYKKALI